MIILSNPDETEEQHDKLLVSDTITQLPITGHGKSTLLSTIVTAIGNFSVQYNFQSISIALIIMSASVCTTNSEDCKEGTQSAWVMSSATATVFIGAITGQLSMGYAGDVLGRNHAMTFTLALVSLAATLSAAAPTGSSATIYIAIIVARFLLGIGVGGVYPLSATKAAEDSGDSDGNVDVTAASWAFFWQVPGSMTPWLLAYIFTYTELSTDARWRLLLGLGAVPSFIVVLCSLMESHLDNKKRKELEEHSRSLHSISAATTGAGDGINSSHSSRGSINNNSALMANQPLLEEGQSLEMGKVEMPSLWELLQKGNTWKNLIATGGGWFIYDIAYYGVNLFGGEILQAINSTDDDNVSADSSVRVVTQEQLIALGTSLPACVFAIWTLKKIGTKNLQVGGFFFITFCFVLLAALFAPLSHGKMANTNALFFVYCMLLFSLSYGPNLTTFILPAETYPKEVRATFNGISAACGKLGAFAGVYMFGPLADGTSYPTVMVVCAVLSAIGGVISYLFVNIPPERRSVY